ncbi:MAG: hypothetical protein WED32_02285 [Patescibacteria group bacterium]
MRVRRVLNIQQKLLYLAQALAVYRFSKGMVGIFIPFVILQGGGTLLMVAGYYLIRTAGKLLLNFEAMRLIRRYGAHVGLALGFTFEVLQLAGIFGFVSTQELAFVLFGGAAAALADAFSDNARHLFIPRIMQDRAKSSSLATLEIMGQVADFLGPLVGAMIGIFLGADWLLAIALVVLTVTYFPLRAMGRIAAFDGTTLRFTFRGAPPRDLIANFCQCADESIGLMLWPIYLAIFLGTFETIGAVAGLTALVTMIVVWVAGRRGDRGRLEPVLRQGTYALSAMNLLRTLAVTPGSIALVGSGYMASREYLLNAWNATFYTHAKRKGLEYVYAMETASGLAYTFIWSLLFVLVLVLDDVRTIFVAVFVLAAALIWGTFLFTRIERRRYAGPFRIR